MKLDKVIKHPDGTISIQKYALAEYDKLKEKHHRLIQNLQQMATQASIAETLDEAGRLYPYVPEPAKEPQPTREFQVGDKVRIVKTQGHALPMSFEGVIDSIDKDGDFVIYDGTLKQFLLPDCLELISAEPEIPDWIAEGKWVEFDGRKFLVREWDEFWIRCVKRVFTDGVDKGGSEYLSDVIKHGEPFTPPPMPELPEVFSYDETNPCLLKHKQGTTMPLEAWIAAIQAKKEYWFEETLVKLLAIQSHIKKWGTE